MLREVSGDCCKKDLEIVFVSAQNQQVQNPSALINWTVWSSTWKRRNKELLFWWLSLKYSDHCSWKLGITQWPFSPFEIQTCLPYVLLGHWIVTLLAETKTSQQAEVLFIKLFLYPVLSFNSRHPQYLCDEALPRWGHGVELRMLLSLRQLMHSTKTFVKYFNWQKVWVIFLNSHPQESPALWMCCTRAVHSLSSWCLDNACPWTQGKTSLLLSCLQAQLWTIAFIQN